MASPEDATSGHRRVAAGTPLLAQACTAGPRLWRHPLSSQDFGLQAGQGLDRGRVGSSPWMAASLAGIDSFKRRQIREVWL